ncbi:ABC transporter substrate-binding protein [Aquincola sp. MAHUQ-54]|uniref:Thiamine pyrimidine synthase n=1 Tax=Aquincola agrisoli TaxID=3119538 RepID=A0AAW9QPU3_9BURK
MTPLQSKPRTARTLRLTALAILAASACAAQAQSPTKLRFALDWVMQGPQAPFLVPHENGCYEKAGLDVVTDRGFGSGDTVIKVAAGTYDVGFADINAMIEYNAKQSKPEERLISFFMIYDGAALSIITRKDVGVAKPADLVGKSIAAPPGDASRRLFPVLAKANGFDANAVKWINVSPELRETMLARKTADAISGAAFTGYMGARAVGIPKEDLVVMRFPQFGASLYGSALVVKPAFASAHAAAITALTQCVADGIVQSIRQPETAIDALYKRDRLINRQVEMERMQLSLDWSIVTPWVREKGFSQIDPVRMEKSLQDVAAALAIPVPAASDVYTDRYLPPRAKLMLPK